MGVNPRSPFVIDTRDLGRRPGSMLELECTAPAPSGWGLDLVRVPPSAPVRLRLRLEAVVDGVLVTASVHAPLEGECGRCLEAFATDLDLDTAELYLYDPDSDDDEDVCALDGDLIDLEPMLRDAVVLALPLNPVCDEECAGLCTGCGARLATLPPGHTHEATDPRWVALRAWSEHSGDSSATMDDKSDLREN